MTGSDGLFFLSTFTTVFVITDPPGNLPVFISLTSKMTPHERKRAAFQATMTSLGVMAAFGLFGHYILRVLGISVESMQISGGLLLAIVALQLLSGHEEDPGAPGSANVAMVPLGIPLMAGPGAIVAVMIAAREALGKGVVGILCVIAAVLLVHLIEWVTMRFANPLHRVLGEGGTIFLTKISGMLLAAIAIQLVINGITTLVRSL
ncbi:membrane protein, MarC family [Actinobaculum sp. oral taxon 183 str. F0552]|uniref:MarC family protein n=1 Tax=Actinobaculum sp. oral taxon 183 TaxID=712888 RepID=UPI000397FB9F|nr:MarC family protein [Actinobaculum sp. oral taxon 183]ERH16821.1 membrane protein, MarC family [Actinobaculum sp. oral taxon 183 str. F0552]